MQPVPRTENTFWRNGGTFPFSVLNIRPALSFSRRRERLSQCKTSRNITYKSKQNRRNIRNLLTINLKRGPPPTKAIPECLVINARSLAKPDAPSALYTEMISNNIDICFVSETWLHDNISSELICPNGYGILRNDRSTSRRGGGVAILYKIDWRISDIIASETFEYLSCKIKRDNAEYFISA